MHHINLTMKTVISSIFLYKHYIFYKLSHFFIQEVKIYSYLITYLKTMQMFNTIIFTTFADSNKNSVNESLM